jgi:hypothetical protein
VNSNPFEKGVLGKGYSVGNDYRFDVGSSTVDNSKIVNIDEGLNI